MNPTGKTAAANPDLGVVRSYTLDNGSTLHVRENHLAPVVNLQVWERTGSIHEGERLGCGLSHFLEHMLFQGSKKYSQSKIMEVVHSNGGEMNAYTSFASTVYHVNILSDAAFKALDVLVDVVFNPVFPAKAFKTEKDVILREAAMSRDNPDRALGELLWKTVFRRHPVRHPIIGYPELIETVDVEMTTLYHRERYTSERTCFVVVGDVEADAVADFLNTAIARIPRVGHEFEHPIIEEPEQKCRRTVETRFDDPLARIDIGFRVPDSTSRDIPALDLLASVLGHSKSARLVRNLRDERRLALNIDAYVYSSVFDGIFTVSATCAPDKIDELETAIFAELSEIRNGVAADELARAKRQMISSFYHTLRSNAGIARLIGSSVHLYGTPDYACKYLLDVKAVGHEDVASVAERMLDPRRASVARMLPTSHRTPTKRHRKPKGGNDQTTPLLSHTKRGARVVWIPDSSTPIVDLAIVLPGGVIRETRANCGVSHMLSRLLLTGTKSMSESEFAKILDDEAVDLSVSGGMNTISIRMSCLRDSLDLAVDALGSMLSEPLFSIDALEREREIVLESLKSRAMSPQAAAEDKMAELLFGSHPYGMNKNGGIESVSNLSADDIADFYFNKVLNNDGAVFGIAGAIDVKAAAKIADRLSTVIPWSSEAVDELPPRPLFPASPKRADVPLPREQSVVLMGMKGCANTSPDRFALDVIQIALNGLETRLFKSIRDDAGLAYYTGLYSSRGIHEGFLAFYAGTEPNSVDRVVKLMNKERVKLAGNGLLQDEFDAAMARMRGEVADNKLKTGWMLFECVLSEFYGNGHQEPWEVMKLFSKLTLREVNSIAEKYFSNKPLALVVAGADAGKKQKRGGGK